LTPMAVKVLSYPKPHPLPPHLPPPWGLRAGRPCRTVLQFYLPPPVWPLAAPPPTPTGRRLGAGWPAGSGSTELRHLPPQNTTGIGSNSPSWADVVRNGPCLSPSPPAGATISSSSTTADFLAMYDCCISSGLKTRINISNLAGVQEITLTCHILTSLASARRRRRPRRHGQAVRAASPTPPPTRPEPPPPLPPEPEPSLPDSPPTPSPPPAKRTRKAAKRRCEVELLRGEEVEDDFYVPPPLSTPPPARSLLLPSPTPTVSPIIEQLL
jgi:hypothetical protein